MPRVLGGWAFSHERGNPVHASAQKDRWLSEQLPHRNVQLFRGGLVLKAHSLRVSLNSGLASNKEEEKHWAYIYLTITGQWLRAEWVAPPAAGDTRN